MTSPNDLTTLAALKGWLGIGSTNDDIVLASLITNLSIAILNNLGRPQILPSVYTEVYDGAGEQSVLLRQWPACELLSLSADGIPVTIAQSGYLPARRSLSAILDGPDAAPPGRMQRVSLLGGLFPHGIQNITASYRAGYEVTAEAALIPSSPPYVVTAAQPYGCWQIDGAVAYANGVSLAPATSPGPGIYSAESGVYTFSASDAGANIILRYGYIPSDLMRACQEWAGERYAYRARIGQSSKSLGGQETTSFIVKDIPDFVSRLLQPYRRVATP